MPVAGVLRPGIAEPDDDPRTCRAHGYASAGCSADSADSAGCGLAFALGSLGRLRAADLAGADLGLGLGELGVELLGGRAPRDR